MRRIRVLALLISLLLGIGLLASLCACQKEPAASTSTQAATEPVTQAVTATARYDEQYRHLRGRMIDEKSGIMSFETCGHEFTCEIIDNEAFIRGCDGETDGVLYMPETVNGIPLSNDGMRKNYNCQRIRFPNFEGSGGGFSTSSIGVWEIAAHEKSLYNDRAVVGRYEVSPNNPYLCDIDGVLFNKDKTVLLDFPEGYENMRFTIPDTVVEIADGAFDLRDATDSFQEILVPSSVTKFPDEWPGASNCFGARTVYVAPDSAAQAYFEQVLDIEQERYEQPRFQLVLREIQAE